MLLAGWEVRIGKNCDRRLENAAIVVSIIANHSTGLDFSSVNWVADSEKIRQVYYKAILSNTATIREGNSTKIDTVFT